MPILLAKEELEEIWGGPLPELEPAYLDIASKMKDAHPQFAPLIFKKLFTLHEAEIVRLLPDSPENIGLKLGIDSKDLETKLAELARAGKILKKGSIYKVFSLMAQFADILYGNAEFDKDKDQVLAKLVLMGNTLGSEEHIEKVWLGLNRGAPINRVIPKWRSIKNIPGVMPCEDMREILKVYQEKTSATRCCIRSVDQ